MTQSEAIEWMIKHQAQAWPFTGLAWENNQLQVRYAGRTAHVKLALDTLGGDTGNELWWQNTHQPRWAAKRQVPVYCIADVPPGAPAHQHAWLLDWGGGRRYFAAEHAHEACEWAAAQHGVGYLWPPVSLAQGGTRGVLQANLKRVFDPQLRINPHLPVQLQDGC